MNSPCRNNSLPNWFDSNSNATLLQHQSLARLNTWRVGGPVEYLFKPKDVAALQSMLQCLPNTVPVHWLGLGSNVLIPDSGLQGVVILTANQLQALELTSPNTIYAAAGVSCAKLARFAAKSGLAGAAFFAGIPGTVGGALAMNAGAFGGTTWEKVVYADTITRAGAMHKRQANEFKVAYRHVEMPATEWFCGAEFSFAAGDVVAEQQAIRELIQKRGKSQPIGELSCGSVFKNPLPEHAARLIEACGLKGYKIGAAEVSPKHANFIINLGDANASDILALINYVQQQVAAKFDIMLEPEVRIL